MNSVMPIGEFLKRRIGDVLPIHPYTGTVVSRGTKALPHFEEACRHTLPVVRGADGVLNGALSVVDIAHSLCHCCHTRHATQIPLFDFRKISAGPRRAGTPNFVPLRASDTLAHLAQFFSMRPSMGVFLVDDNRILQGRVTLVDFVREFVRAYERVVKLRALDRVMFFARSAKEIYASPDDLLLDLILKVFKPKRRALIVRDGTQELGILTPNIALMKLIVEQTAFLEEREGSSAPPYELRPNETTPLMTLQVRDVLHELDPIDSVARTSMYRSTGGESARLIPRTLGDEVSEGSTIIETLLRRHQIFLEGQGGQIVGYLHLVRYAMDDVIKFLAME